MRIAETTKSVVLVEGESDRQAILATARTLRRDLDTDHTEVVAMGGATSVESYARELGHLDVQVRGLCDQAEVRYFSRVLDLDDIFVCRSDLEDELIRALGIDEMVAFISSQGELQTFRTMQKQPTQRDRSIEQQLHRFCGIKSGRKVRYAQAMVEWLPVDRLPEPLRSLAADL